MSIYWIWYIVPAVLGGKCNVISKSGHESTAEVQDVLITHFAGEFGLVSIRDGVECLTEVVP